MAKTTITHVLVDGKPVLVDRTPAVRAGKKVVKRSTGKRAGEFESSNRDTTGKRIARALWG